MRPKVNGRYSVVLPQSPAIPDDLREEETKQKCPICRGSGKLNIQDIGLSRIKYDPCKCCGGNGMVTITEIKAFTAKG